MLIRILIIVGFTLIGVLFLGLIGLHLVDFSRSPDEVAAAYRDLPVEPTEFAFSFGDHQIHGLRAGNPEKPCIIFAHGSPGTWDNFLDLMSDPLLLQNAQLLAFDRPGFGKSEPRIVERSLPKQATVVAGIIDRVAANQTAILVGHSYGGAVIAQTAVDYPEKVSGLVMIAASVSPQLEKKYWYNHIAEWSLINWALPKDLLTSNREILALKSELIRLAPRLKTIKGPVVIVHGKKDRLVPFANVDFMKSEFRGAQVLVETHPDWGHFIPWEQPQVIREALLTLVELKEQSNQGRD